MSTESVLQSSQIEILADKGWTSLDLDKLNSGESNLHKLKAQIDLAPAKGKGGPIAFLLGFSAILGAVGLASADVHSVHALSGNELRACGFTEDVLGAGYREFAQIADVRVVTGDSVSTSYLENNLSPGERGYVYPGVDDRINFGDQIAGYYPVCQMNVHAAALMFYAEIGE